MASTIPSLLQIGIVAAVAFLPASSNAQPTTPSAALVRYSFDDDLLDAGPDTFSVFQFGQGTVALNTNHRFSGYRSVELRDIPGDHSFPELQGYFPLRAKGILYLHFAFMMTNPAEELNIALAGPEWFNLRKDGIGFWLKTAEGQLTVISDSIPKKLFAPRPFAWYVVDAAYAIDAGTFDLTIREDGIAVPVIELRAQPNAPNQPGSRVDKFSFIGDHLTDESKVIYYVDDVLLGVDEAIVHQPFAAPGRRKLFVDYWNEAQKHRATHPQPLPLLSLEDLGIGQAEAAALKQDQASDSLGDILAGKAITVPNGLPGRSRAMLQSVIAWRDGSAALRSGDAERALSLFDEATRLSPDGRLFAIDAVMALAHLARWDEADRRLASIVPRWRNDPRLPATLATIGLARGDLSEVERQLRVGAEDTGLMAEEYFLALLWKGDSARAERFAQGLIAKSAAPEQASWRERLADAAFLAGDTQRARDLYQASLAGHPHPSSVWLRLSDVYFKLGDLEQERIFRERVYGGLGNVSR